MQVMRRAAASSLPLLAAAGGGCAYLAQAPIRAEDVGPAPPPSATPVEPVFLKREFQGPNSGVNQDALDHVVGRTLEMYDCKMTKQSLDIVAEDCVFEDVFMRLPGVHMVRAGFDGMRRAFDAERKAVMVDLHTYPPDSCLFVHSDVPGPAQTDAAPAGAGAGADATSAPEPRHVPGPAPIHATDRAVVMRLTYTYTILGMDVPYDTVVRLYIRDVGVDPEGPGDTEATPPHLRWRVVRWEDMLWGAELLSWKNGGLAGGAFAFTRRLNGAIYYVLHTVFCG